MAAQATSARCSSHSNEFKDLTNLLIAFLKIERKKKWRLNMVAKECILQIGNNTGEGLFHFSKMFILYDIFLKF